MSPVMLRPFAEPTGGGSEASRDGAEVECDSNRRSGDGPDLPSGAHFKGEKLAGVRILLYWLTTIAWAFGRNAWSWGSSAWAWRARAR
jgi:hypothetical protein